jgi:hypothetical protein
MLERKFFLDFHMDWNLTAIVKIKDFFHHKNNIEIICHISVPPLSQQVFLLFPLHKKILTHIINWIKYFRELLPIYNFALFLRLFFSRTRREKQDCTRHVVFTHETSRFVIQKRERSFLTDYIAQKNIEWILYKKK